MFTLCSPKSMLGLFLAVGVLQIDSACPKPCRCSHYGQGQLQVRCEDKKLDSIPPGIPKQTSELYLGYNSLSHIPDGAFSDLTQLRQLSLKHNFLTRLDDGAFKGLSQLTSLFLTKNNLSIINKEVFSPLISLKNIYLTQNNLQAIPDMGDAVKLRKLNLNNNDLKNASFPAGYSKAKALQSINMNVNPQITAINRADFSALGEIHVVKLSLERCGLHNIENGTFSMLPSLVSLRLAYNKIPAQDLKYIIAGLRGSYIASLDLSGVITNGTLPSDTFDALVGVPLLHLNLRHSEISQIHRQTFQYLNHLQSLDFSFSQIDLIETGAFNGLKKLQSLLLHHNRLKKLPTELPKSCLHIDFSYNALAVTELEVGVVDDLSQLQELYIHHCELAKIAVKAFDSTVNLRKLDLSNNLIPNNNIGSEVFQSLNKLEMLDLSHNRLVNFEQEHSIFKYLNKLRMLNMSNNRCENLPMDSFNELANLESLDLSYNNLGSEIAGCKDLTLFETLQKLVSLNISNNNIKILPSISFRNLHELKYLRLENNDISKWKGTLFTSTVSLLSLNLADNHISVVNQSSLDIAKKSLTSINLSNNPFSCYCSLVWFRNWINTTNITFENLDTYTCSSPKNMVGKTVLSFVPSAIEFECKPPPWLIIIIAVSGCVFILACLLGIILYRNRWKIRLAFYLRIQKKREAAQNDEVAIINDDFKYDCFVSVTDEDEDWVRDFLLPKMDNGEALAGTGGFDYGPEGHGQHTLCCAAIHLPPGGPVFSQIAEAINDSRKVMILLTREYLQSGQQMEFELQLALDKVSKQGWNCIILVILDEGADVRIPHGKLHELMDNGEELRWTEDPNGQEMLWNRLTDHLNNREVNPIKCTLLETQAMLYGMALTDQQKFWSIYAV